jgi:hypothetical protein
VTHSITIPIWDSRLHILLWPNDLPAALTAVSLTEGADEIIDEDCEAITQLNDISEPVIVIKKECEGATLTGLLAHEVFHAVQDLLDERGVKLSKKGNNEAHAYLIGWIMEEAVKIVVVK